MFTPGLRGSGCKTVSGRRYWLNRDPLGEYGGYNLYSTVYNSPFAYIDPDGETPVGIGIGGGIGAVIGGGLGGFLGGAGGTLVLPGVGTIAGAAELGAAGAAAGTALGGALGNFISELPTICMGMGGKRGQARANPSPDKAAVDKAAGRDRATGKVDRPPQENPDVPLPPDPLRGKFPKEPPGKIMPPKDGGPAPIRGGR